VTGHKTSLRRAGRRHVAAREWYSLTQAEAEAELAKRVADGMTNPEIAARLHISRHTVDGRLSRGLSGSSPTSSRSTSRVAATLI